MSFESIGRARDHGLGVLYIDHNMSHVLPVADRIVLLELGRVVRVIAPSLTDPFWITQQNGANQAGEDFGVNVVFQAPAQDTGDAGMVPLVQAAIAAQPAGIAIDYTSKTMEARHRRRARCRHPGRPLQQQPLRGRERAGRRAHPRPCLCRPERIRLRRDADQGVDVDTSGRALQGADRQSVPDRLRADAARRRREAGARRGRLSLRGSRRDRRPGAEPIADQRRPAGRPAASAASSGSAIRRPTRRRNMSARTASTSRSRPSTSAPKPRSASRTAR